VKEDMRTSKFVLFAAVAALAFGFTATAPLAHAAQINISIGAAPSCPYGYYDYAPYSCAPYGYYGPEWFNGGVFIGAGKWFHGPKNFHGTVNNHYDVQHGYHGATPHAGDRPDPKYHGSPAPAKFKGNESRDGQGHATKR
jgi:hypothetical protein